MNHPSADISHNAIVTLQAHILQQQANFPAASGTLSWILSALSISAKIIANSVRRARLDDVLGSPDEVDHVITHLRAHA